MKKMRKVSQLRFQLPKSQEVKLKSKKKLPIALLLPITPELTWSKLRKPRNTNSRLSRIASLSIMNKLRRLKRL